MSILNGEVVLDGETLNGKRNNGNNGGKNKKRRDFSRNEGRSYGDGYYAFSKSSYLPDELKEELNEEAPTANEEVNDERVDLIDSFCDNFTDSTSNYRSLKDVIVEQFPSVIGFIKQYYSNKNKPVFTDALNRLIKTISTTPFANTLGQVLDDGIWTDDDTYDKIWSSIAYGLSIALELNHDRMHTDVVRKYATVILPRMWGPEIKSLTVNAGITKDLALDLFIAIPMKDEEWNGANIDAFYHRFLDKMIIHAEDNMDVLNWEVQGILYDEIFGKSKTALKVIGKYLTSNQVAGIDSEIGQAVYDEFKKMLYSKLDKYDIREIEYVFDYVARYVKENPNKQIIFDSVQASKYENVRKGLLSVMDRNPDNMKYLA